MILARLLFSIVCIGSTLTCVGADTQKLSPKPKKSSAITVPTCSIVRIQSEPASIAQPLSSDMNNPLESHSSGELPAPLTNSSEHPNDYGTLPTMSPTASSGLFQFCADFVSKGTKVLAKYSDRYGYVTNHEHEDLQRKHLITAQTDPARFTDDEINSLASRAYHATWQLLAAAKAGDAPKVAALMERNPHLLGTIAAESGKTCVKKYKQTANQGSLNADKLLEKVTYPKK